MVIEAVSFSMLLVSDVMSDNKSMELFGRIHKKGKVLKRLAVGLPLFVFGDAEFTLFAGALYWVLFNALVNVIVLDQDWHYSGAAWTWEYDSKIDTFLGKYNLAVQLTVLLLTSVNWVFGLTTNLTESLKAIFVN